MQSVILIGNSITAEVLYHLINEDNRYRIEGFAVDKEYIKEHKFLGCDVIEINDIPKMFDKSVVKVILAIGYKNLNQNRENIYNRIAEIGFDIETYIHQKAMVYTKDIGKGSIILPGSILDPCSKIGRNTVIWSNVVCAHHSVVGDNCWIASGSVVSGEAEVKNNSFIGVGAIIVNKVVIAEYNIIGARAFMTKSTSAEEVFLTKSAEKIPFKSKEYANVYGY